MKSRHHPRTIFLFIALPLLTVLYTLAMNAYFVGFFNDDAFFILGARSLTHGAFLDLARPGHPPLLSYLPGTSVLYLPVAFISGGFVSYQVWAILISVFAMGLTGPFLDESFGWPLLPAAFLLTAINPLMTSLAATILSDIPYLVATILFFHGLFHWHNELDLGRTIILAMAAAAATYIRPLGASVIIIFGVGLLIRRQYKFAFAATAASTAALLPFLIRNYLVKGYLLSYGEQFLSPFGLNFSLRDHLIWIASNFWNYAQELFGRVLFRWPFTENAHGWKMAMALIGIASTAIGFSELKRNFFSAILKSYFLIYLITICLWRVYSGRYLLPIVPIAVSFVFLAVRKIGAKIQTRFLTWGSIAVVVFFLVAPLHKILKASLDGENIANTPPARTFTWIKRQTQPDDIFAVAAEAQFYLWTDRSCVQYPAYQSADFISRWCDENNITYIVVSSDEVLLKTREEEKIFEKQGVSRWQIPRNWIRVYADPFEKMAVYRRA